MDKNQVIHDLTILHLEKTGDALSPKELVEQYFESEKIFKSAYEEYKKENPKPTGKSRAVPSLY